MSNDKRDLPKTGDGRSKGERVDYMVTRNDKGVIDQKGQIHANKDQTRPSRHR